VLNHSEAVDDIELCKQARRRCEQVHAIHGDLDALPLSALGKHLASSLRIVEATKAGDTAVAGREVREKGGIASADLEHRPTRKAERLDLLDYFSIGELAEITECR
jgi:hypothetical protein